MRYLRKILGVVEEPNCFRPWSPILFVYRVRHRLTGPRRGCSCSTRCFDHPRRRVPAQEIYRDRVRLARLEQRVRDLERS